MMMSSTLCLLVSLFLAISLVTASLPSPGENKYDAFRSGILRDYSESNARFTVDLYHAMRQTHNNSNFVVSPFGIHSLLSMVQLAAGGETRAQVVNTLHARSLIHSGFQMYNESLELGQGENTTLMFARTLCTSRNFSPKTRFLNALNMYYDPQVFQYRTRRGVQEVNRWMSHQTNEMIPEILDPGDLSSDSLTLASGMYFKALWQEAFHEGDTSLQTFTEDGGKTHRVIMMQRYMKIRLRQSNSINAKVMKLPFKGGRYSLYLLVPRSSKTLEYIEQRFTHTTLQDDLDYLAKEETYIFERVQVMVPRFGLDTSVDLDTVLEKLGVSSMYNMDTSNHNETNFKPMTSEEIRVKTVKHRCVLEVDEQGETSRKLETVSYPKKMHANKPFIFFLRDDLHGIILMIGRYVNPQGDHVMV